MSWPRTSSRHANHRPAKDCRTICLLDIQVSWTRRPESVSWLPTMPRRTTHFQEPAAALELKVDSFKRFSSNLPADRHRPAAAAVTTMPEERTRLRWALAGAWQRSALPYRRERLIALRQLHHHHHHRPSRTCRPRHLHPQRTKKTSTDRLRIKPSTVYCIMFYGSRGALKGKYGKKGGEGKEGIT